MSQALQAESGETFWRRHHATVEENPPHHSREGVGWLGGKCVFPGRRKGLSKVLPEKETMSILVTFQMP